MGLLITGADFANTVERLLDCLGNLDFLGTNTVEHWGHGAARHKQRSKGHGHAPECRNSQLPTKEERSHKHHSTRNNGAPQLAQHVAVGMLHSLHVTHDGFG